jgi:4,5-dihydroxyphthalate decarboxylase
VAKDPVTLSFWLGNYPNTLPLKKGEITSELVTFDFPEVKIANRGFKSIVRDLKYDVGELAIGTYLQAKAYNKPYVLLPICVMGRGQHHTIAYNPERGELRPADLNGKRVGVRAYTQTTGAWLRGILADDYGVNVDSIRWITFEEPHVGEYEDPDIVERAPEGKELVQMLLDGEVDAAIVGDSMPDKRLKYLISDPERVAEKWAGSHGGVPINHMVVIRDEISKSRPDVVREVFRMLVASKEAAHLPESGTPLDPRRIGVEANRKSLEIIIDYCLRQRLIPRRFTVDELFDDTTRALGA